MKKFLSIFVALAMVLSLFAGVGARSAKAATILPAAIAGITVPVTGGTPVASTPAGTVAGTVYATSVAWAPTVSTTFAASTSYTATITLATIAPPADFTGVTANYFTVAGATTVSNAADSGTVYAVFPATAALIAINTAAIPVTAPVTGGTPQATVAATSEYAVATITWSTTPATTFTTFATGTIYTAKFTLVPTAAYTLTGVTANFFTVAGATTTNAAASGAVTAVFPATVATPLVPTGLVTLAVPTQVLTTTNVKLTWTYAAGIAAGEPVTGFNIYRSLVNTIPSVTVNAPIATVTGAATLTYTDTATAAGQQYYYWVTAINGVGPDAAVSNGVSIYTTTATTAVVVPVTTTTSTLTLTPAGNFVGGVDGSGALGVDAIGTVVSGSGTSYVVNVTTAGVGVLDIVNGIKVLHDTGVTSVDADWATTGIQTITLGTLPITGILNVGDTMRVYGSSTKGVGKILGIDATGTHAVVNVTTAAVGVIGPQIYKTTYIYPAVIDTDWLTVGTAQPITFATAVTLAAGDILDVAMLQAVPAVSATAFLIVSGTPVKGDVATVTWQDTLAASHTVSYTAVTGDTATSVALALSQLINALDVTTGNVTATVVGSLVTLVQDVGGVAGNGKTLTATTTAAVTPTLTIHTVGGLNSPAYVELGKTIKLVAVDATGAVISCTWTSVGSAAPAGPSAVVNTSGLVTADLALTGVTVVTATSGSATGVFAVVVIPVQIITSLKINLVPALPVSTTVQQFGAIASNAAYSALDYTTQAVWTDALPVASIAATTGLLTYSTDETGNVYAAAGGITATAAVKITTGVVTLVTVVGPVTKVVVLTIGSDIVTVDDKATTVDAAPEIVDGRTFVPIRFIAETFGSTVTWLPETKGITIVLGDTTIGLQIGNATAVINGTIIALDAAPYIKNSRTMVPLRVITESFGGNVAWDPINHIITITYVLPVVPAA
jgi:hypothetical protein